MHTLDFKPALDHPELLSSSVFKALADLKDTDCQVAEIDPALAGGEDLCRHFNIPFASGGNTVIVEAVRGESKIYAACLLPVGARADFNGTIRKHLNARRVSLAPLDFVLKETGMEYGSITIVGLPKDWLILIDESFLSQQWMIMSSGTKAAKLRLTLDAILALPKTVIIRLKKQE